MCGPVAVSTVSVSEGVSLGDAASGELVLGVVCPEATEETREAVTGAATLMEVAIPGLVSAELVCLGSLTY